LDPTRLADFGLLAQFIDSTGRERVKLSAMSDVTRILAAIEQGDLHAAAELLPLVYDKHRRLAAQRMAQD
jgi:hypothetical protein